MKYYKVNEIAEIFNMHPQSIRNAISKGKIKAIKILGATRISQEEFERLVKEKGDRSERSIN